MGLRREVPYPLLPALQSEVKTDAIKSDAGAKVHEWEEDAEGLKALLLKLKGQNMELKAKLAEIQAKREVRLCRGSSDERDRGHSAHERRNFPM